MTKALIRDDGVVFQWREEWASWPNFRFYDGPIPCTQEQGVAWLNERTGKTPTAPASEGPSSPNPEPVAPVAPPAAVITSANRGEKIDLAKATREEMIAYAEKVLQRRFPAGWSTDMIRNRVADAMGIESPAEVVATAPPVSPSDF